MSPCLAGFQLTCGHPLAATRQGLPPPVRTDTHQPPADTSPFGLVTV